MLIQRQFSFITISLLPRSQDNKYACLQPKRRCDVGFFFLFRRRVYTGNVYNKQTATVGIAKLADCDCGLTKQCKIYELNNKLSLLKKWLILLENCRWATKCQCRSDVGLIDYYRKSVLFVYFVCVCARALSDNEFIIPSQRTLFVSFDRQSVDFMPLRLCPINKIQAMALQ